MEDTPTPKLCQNICLLNIYRYQKTLPLKVKPFKNLIFGSSILGGLRGRGVTPKLCQNICLLNIY